MSAQARIFYPDALTPVRMPCDACGELRRVQSGGYLAFHPCPASFTEESEGHATSCCHSEGEPFKALAATVAEPSQKPAAHVYLDTPSGKVHWRLTSTGRAWWTCCPAKRCGGPIYINAEALRPGAVQCGRCKAWVPTP